MRSQTVRAGLAFKTSERRRSDREPFCRQRFTGQFSDITPLHEMALKLPAPPWESPSWQGAPAALDDVIASLDEQRQVRELALQLRLGLQDARAEFSYLRVKGLKTLTATVNACVSSPEWMRRFRDTQQDTNLQSETFFLMASL